MERAREHGRVLYQWRDYDAIADDLKRAVLISEDARFVEHFGFDWRGIRHAMERNEEAGRWPAAPPLPSNWPRTCT